MTASSHAIVGFSPPSRPPATWVADQLSMLGAESVLCLFSGWGSEARELKRRGFSVTTADPLESSAWWSRAFIADTSPMTERKLGQWLKLQKDPEVVKRFLPWANLYFTPEETIWLSIWHQCLVNEPDPIAVVAVYWAIRYWLSWNRHELGFKPHPPSATLRRYVEEANRMLERIKGRPQGRAEKIPPERALTKFPSELLYCYVPPVGGIGALGVEAQVWEQWTCGDPASEPLLFPDGALGGAFQDPRAHLGAITRILEGADQFPFLALAYQGSLGGPLDKLVSARRPVLSRRELEVPYPGPAGSSIIIQGLLIAGNRDTEGIHERPRAEGTDE